MLEHAVRSSTDFLLRRYGEGEEPSGAAFCQPLATWMSAAAALGCILTIVVLVFSGVWVKRKADELRATQAVVREVLRPLQGGSPTVTAAASSGDSPGAPARLTSSGGERQSAYDNTRLLIAVLIFYGHVKYYDVAHPESWMGGDDGGIFSRFFMPLSSHFALSGAALLSGALSKGPATAHRWRSVFVFVVLPTAFYTALLCPLLEVSVGDGSLPRDWRTWLLRLVRPYSVEWYLFALAVWRIATLMLSTVSEKVGSPLWPWVVGVAVGVAVSFPYLWLPRFWSSRNSRFYFPSFVIGLLYPVEELLSVVPSTWPWKLAGASVVAIWVAQVGSWEFGAAPAWPLGRFVAMLPSKGPGVISESACPLEFVLFPFQALLGSILPAVVYLVVIVFLAPRGDAWYTRMGREGSLYVYLLHPFTVKVFFRATEQLPNPNVSKELGGWLYFFVQLAFVLVTTAAIAAPPTIRLFAPFLAPQWLGDLLLGTEAKATVTAEKPEEKGEQSEGTPAEEPRRGRAGTRPTFGPQPATSARDC